MTTFCKHYAEGMEEGRAEYYVNGEMVGSADHDNDGWSGMESLNSMFEKIAQQLEVEVVVTYATDEELDHD